MYIPVLYTRGLGWFVRPDDGAEPSVAYVSHMTIG